MTTGYGHPSSGGSAPAGGWPPATVTAVAQRRQLGACLATRRPAQPTTRLLADLAAAGGLLLLLVLVSSVSDRLDGAWYGLARAVALGACFGALAGIGDAIRTLMAVGREESFYLYQGGLLRRAGSYVRAITWPEVREVHPAIGTNRGGVARTEGYVLVPHTGPSGIVPGDHQEAPDPFVDHLTALLRQHIPAR